MNFGLERSLATDGIDRDIDRVDSTLDSLFNDPEKLDRARGRFDRPPPVYRSYSSGTTTQPPGSGNSDGLTEGERWLLDQRVKLRLDYFSCSACNLFDQQVSIERQRLIEAIGKGPWRIFSRRNNCGDVARENIEKQWIEQGIWNPEWDREKRGGWKWKHQEPFPLVQAEAEREDFGPLFSYNWNPEIERKEEEEREKIEKEQAIRDKSRPFHQFVYQVSKTREWIQQQSGLTTTDARYPFDIHTTAYEDVKKTWTNNGIWDRKWGILPGMSWKNEQPLEAWLEEEMAYLVSSGQGPRKDTPREPLDSEAFHLQMDACPLPNSGVHTPSLPPLASGNEASPVPAREVAQEDQPMIDNPPGTPNSNPASLPRQASPRRSPRERTPPARPARGRKKAQQDLAPQDAPVLRRSKRLQAAKLMTATDNEVAPALSGKQRGRPKREISKAGGSAQQPVSPKDARASKRQRLKQNRARK
ncbi:hypothetical protein F4802DRAFT_603268 [Xylaria palmicola]|nr:hypothetical protein F4802DRAFT_603268 [Xylaria palmicola]